MYFNSYFVISKSVRNEFSSERVRLHYKGHKTAFFLFIPQLCFPRHTTESKIYDWQYAHIELI